MTWRKAEYLKKYAYNPFKYSVSSYIFNSDLNCNPTSKLRVFKNKNFSFAIWET